MPSLKQYARQQIARGFTHVGIVIIHEPGVIHLGKYLDVIDSGELEFISIEGHKEQPRLFALTAAIKHIEFMTADAVDGIKAQAKFVKPDDSKAVELNRQQRRHPGRN